MSPILVQLSRVGALAFVASVATFTFQPPAQAAPPANDTCAGAIQVSAVPYLSPVIDVLNATTNGDPVPLPPYTGLKRSIWFRFVPAATARYTVSVGEDTETNFGDPQTTDTVMGIYSSSGGCAGPFTRVAENDDEGFLRSAISTNLNSGVTYYIVVWVGPVSQDTNQALNVQLRVTRPVVPANDLCSGAIVVPPASLPFVSANIDTYLATDTGEPFSDCEYYRGVWFTFTPTASDTYIFGFNPEPATSLIDPILAIFRSTGGCAGPFTEVTCTNIKTRLIILPLTAGTTYYILAGDIEPEPIPGATSVQLSVKRAGPPTVTTLPATSLTSTGAVLNMEINPNGLRTRYFFEWGISPAYGTTTLNRVLFMGNADVFASPVTANAAIGGLTPGVYHFRAVGSNSLGKVFGADQSFRYSTDRPTILSPIMQPAGTFRFRFTANSNQVYLIQSTTDLIQWNDSGTAVDRGGGSFDFSTSAPAGSRRIYKVRSP